MSDWVDKANLGLGALSGIYAIDKFAQRHGRSILVNKFPHFRQIEQQLQNLENRGKLTALTQMGAYQFKFYFRLPEFNALRFQLEVNKNEYEIWVFPNTHNLRLQPLGIFPLPHNLNKFGENLLKTIRTNQHKFSHGLEFIHEATFKTKDIPELITRIVNGYHDGKRYYRPLPIKIMKVLPNGILHLRLRNILVTLELRPLFYKVKNTRTDKEIFRKTSPYTPSGLKGQLHADILSIIQN